jgi:uncharacterized protein
MTHLPTDATHRPWPLPGSPWVVAMRWNHLAFLHWPVEHDVLRPLVPGGLELETHDGRAWIGITPFEMSNVRVRLTPALPRISRFPELNVRTYVSNGGKSGIWFFSLDVASRLVVPAARAVFGLPYHRASMTIHKGPDIVDYRCSRKRTGGSPLRFRASYQGTGPIFHAEPDTLEHWLTERYCLYSLIGGRLHRAEIDHVRWPLQSASVEIAENTMASPIGMELDPAPPLVHFARRLDVVAWLPAPVGDRGSS